MMSFSFNPMREENFEFYDRSLLVDIQLEKKEVFEFFRFIALCHTVMAETLEKGMLANILRSLNRGRVYLTSMYIFTR